MIFETELDRDTIKGLLYFLSDENEIVKFIKKFHDLFPSMISSFECISKHSYGTNENKNYDNNFRGFLSENVFSVIKNTDTFYIFEEINKFKSDLERYNEFLLFTDTANNTSEIKIKLFDEFIKRLNAFNKAYQYIDKSSNPGFGNEINIIAISNFLYETIRNIRHTLCAIMTNFEKLLNEIKLGENEKILELKLEETSDVDNLYEIIDALKNLYSILCEIFEIDKEKFPLQIIEIKSGSIEIIIKGYDAIIVIITLLIIGKLISAFDSEKIAEIIIQIAIEKFSKNINHVDRKTELEECTERITNKSNNIEVNGTSYKRGSHTKEQLEKSLDKTLKESIEKPAKTIQKPKSRKQLVEKTELGSNE